MSYRWLPLGRLRGHGSGSARYHSSSVSPRRGGRMPSHGSWTCGLGRADVAILDPTSSSRISISFSSSPPPQPRLCVEHVSGSTLRPETTGNQKGQREDACGKRGGRVGHKEQQVRLTRTHEARRHHLVRRRFGRRGGGRWRARGRRRRVCRAVGAGGIRGAEMTRRTAAGGRSRSRSSDGTRTRALGALVGSVRLLPLGVVPGRHPLRFLALAPRFRGGGRGRGHGSVFPARAASVHHLLMSQPGLSKRGCLGSGGRATQRQAQAGAATAALNKPWAARDDGHLSPRYPTRAGALLGLS